MPAEYCSSPTEPHRPRPNGHETSASNRDSNVTLRGAENAFCVLF